MPRYGKTSRARLETCDGRLQRLFNSLIEDYDISILCGYRSEEEQNKAFDEGRSKVRFPDGKHNSYPSKAIDCTLFPVIWEDTGRHYLFGGLVLERAKQLGIPLRWGGDWNGNMRTNDQNFNDLVHFEIAEEVL